ncbi:MAG: tetratricopeptide repeat protein [Candidatus Acidiferrales bacterium]
MDGLKPLIEAFGFRHGIELFIFLAGFPVVRYCARTYWDKKKKSPEILSLTAWALLGCWYLWAFYGERYTPHPFIEFAALLVLTVAWLCGLWFSLFADDRRIKVLRADGARLQEQGLHRAAAEKFRSALEGLSLPQNRKHYFDTLYRLGECELQTGPPAAARKDFEDLVAHAVALNDPAWHSRGVCGLGCVDYLCDDRNDVALQEFQQAIELSQNAKDPEGEAAARRDLGDLHRFLGHFSEARREYDQALLLFRSRRNPAGEAGVLRGLGDLELASAVNGGRAREYLEAAAKLYKSAHYAPGIANTQLILGRLERILGNYNAARQHFRSASATFQNSGDKLGYANGLLLLGEADRELSSNEEARNNFTRALDLFMAENENEGKANCLRDLGYLDVVRAELPEARKKYVEARRLYVQQGDRLGQGNIFKALGDLEAILGKYDLCRTYFDDASRLFTVERSDSDLADLALRRARLEYELAAFSKARQCCQEALAVIAPGNQLDAAFADNFLAQLEVTLGDYSSAQTRLEKCRAYFNKSGHASEEAEALRGLADVLAATGKPDKATQLYAAAKAIFQKTEDVLGEGSVLLRTAELERSRNRNDLAGQYLDAAQKIFDAAGYQMRQADVLLARGELAKALQDPARAKTNFAAARTLYDSLGNRFGAARADFADAQLGGSGASGLFTVAQASFTILGLPHWAQKAQAEIDKLKVPTPHN